MFKVMEPRDYAQLQNQLKTLTVTVGYSPHYKATLYLSKAKTNL